MKKFLLAMLLGVSAFATAPASTIPTTDFKFAIDRWMGPTAFNQSLGTRVYRSHTTGYGTWDFAVNGGANGAATVGLLMPAKAIVRQVFFDTITAVAPAGVSISWGMNSATDIKTAQAASVWTGQVAGIQTGAVAQFLKATAATNISATLSGSTATAGKIRIFVDYVVSE